MECVVPDSGTNLYFLLKLTLARRVIALSSYLSSVSAGFVSSLPSEKGKPVLSKRAAEAALMVCISAGQRPFMSRSLL